MPLTPNDILQKRFPSGFRGLAGNEVYAFLRTVAEEVEQARREAADARAAVTRLEEELEEYRHMESTLRNTLVSSQKVGQEIRAEAEHRRELIIREAELEAERRLQEVEVHRQELEHDILRLVAQRRRFEAEFAALIESHTRLLHHHDDAALLDYDGPDTRQLAFDDIMSAVGASDSETPEPETDSEEADIIEPSEEDAS